VFVSPLRYGSGMKGKVGESMSYGLPVVTTTVGAEGIGLTNMENALIADDPRDFADAVCRLYTDAELWNRISSKSMEHIDARFSKASIRRELSALFTACGI
jgi:glycosyltransferase involved in cell wall biosynthesis